MPLLPLPVIRYSATNSKSAGLPPSQMMNELWSNSAPGAISPISTPPSARQRDVSPRQPVELDPSNSDIYADASCWFWVAPDPHDEMAKADMAIAPIIGNFIFLHLYFSMTLSLPIR